MAIVLGHLKSPLLQPANRLELVATFFHPAYLVRNGVAAFDGLQLNVPAARYGDPDAEAANQLRALDEEGNPIAVGASAEAPMLPPRKFRLDTYRQNASRGRPSTRRKRSRGEPSGGGGAARPRDEDRGGASDSGARSLLHHFDCNGF